VFVFKLLIDKSDYLAVDDTNVEQHSSSYLPLVTNGGINVMNG